MRASESLTALIGTVVAAFFLVALVLVGPHEAFAGEPREISTEPFRGPDSRSLLDETDELATLDALHTALTEVADGGTYVWHRMNGRMSAIMQITQSFKDGDGHVCRHLVVMLVAGPLTRKTEGIACRAPDRRWHLDG